jgi:hypothetical protein
MLTVRGLPLLIINCMSSGRVKINIKINIKTSTHRPLRRRTTQTLEMFTPMNSVKSSMIKVLLPLATINMMNAIEQTTGLGGHPCSRMIPPTPTRVDMHLEIKDLRLLHPNIGPSVSFVPTRRAQYNTDTWKHVKESCPRRALQKLLRGITHLARSLRNRSQATKRNILVWTRQWMI